MPKLIGTAPNQVPTNGSLGNMAFQNKEGVITDLLSTTALTVTGTGAASFAGTIAASLGSAAAPSYTFTGDTNTGIFSPGADTIAFSEGGVEVMRIDASGNLGLGTTPNAWGSTWKASQVSVSALANNFGSSASLNLVNNVFYDSAGASRYIGTGFATRYVQTYFTGEHQWFNAPSGTAGDVATLTERMRIDSIGRVGIGTAAPNASALLDVTSTTSGFLPPRMTTTQRNAIATPADGLVVYNTTIGALEVRQAGQWVNPSTAGIVNTPVAMETDFINEYYTSRRSERTFDQLIDFTRTTAATFVGSNGLIQNTPASVNLLTQTQQFDVSPWSNQVGGTGVAATVTANAGTAPDNTSTADRLQFSLAGGTTTADITRRKQDFSTPATTHTFSVYLRSTDGTSTYNMHIVSPAGATTNIVVTGSWQRFTVTGTGTGGVISYTVGLRGGQTPANSNTADVLAWGAQLEVGSTATTYTRNNGGVYPPRFDYDPVTLAAKGLLIEEQRVNLLTYSEQFDNAAWIKNNGTITANSTTSPDGATTADTFTASAGSAFHYTNRAGLVVTGSHVHTFYVKKNTATWIFFTVSDSGINYFNLDTGLFGTTPDACTATAVGNGWYRISAVRTLAAVQANCGIGIAGSNGGANFTAAGTESIFIWGAQLEAGAFATSYIPTVASQVTRSADVATMTGTNFSSWFNQTKGTFVVGYDSAASGFGVLGNNTSGYVLASSTRDLKTFNGTTSVASANTLAVGAIGSGAVSYDSTGRSVVLNGGAIATAAGVLQTITTLFIGHDAAFSGARLNGHIRSVRYYPIRLSNAQLQALTA
jgi:hypothetical protein